MAADKEFQFKQEFIGLYSEIDLTTLLDKIAEKISEYLGCEQASIFLYDSIREELFFEVATGDEQGELKKIVMRKGQGLVGWVAEHEEAEIVNDCSQDPRFSSRADSKTQFTTHSLLAVPVIQEQKLLGVLEAVNKINGLFSPDDQILLESIAQFVSIPLQNAMLFHKITTETRGKERLIELGKTISHSFDLDEVFDTLRDILHELIDPLEINVLVKSEDQTYQLIPKEKGPYKDTGVDETVVGSNQAVFPLRTKNKTLGFLELKVRQRIPRENLSLIKGIAIFAAISIEKIEMYQRMLEKERLEQELQIAKKIQQAFLPSAEVKVEGLDVACLNIPSSEVGGDYYDIIQEDDTDVIFTINDISGHGIPASLPMSIFSANFKYHVSRDRDMLVTIDHLNNLIAETTDASQSVTSFTCQIDLEKMIMHYLNAGHHPPVFIRGGKFIELEESSFPLGWFTGVERTLGKAGIEKDDLLVFFTDGVIEAENNRKEQYSQEQLNTFLLRHKHLGAGELKDRLIGELKSFTGKDVFVDDVTFIIIKVK